MNDWKAKYLKADKDLQQAKQVIFDLEGKVALLSSEIERLQNKIN